LATRNFFLARGELTRHVVERRRKRSKFCQPRLVRRTHLQIAAAEARRRAHQPSDRVQNQPLAAEPGREKNEHAEYAELHISDRDFPIDPAVHCRLADAKCEPRLCVRHADETEDALRSVEVDRRRRAFVFRQQFLGQAVTGEIFADETFRIGRSGHHRTATVDHQHLGAGARHRIGRQFADPIRIERGDDDRGNCAALLPHRKRGHGARHTTLPFDKIVAERKLMRIQRSLKIRTIGHV
jgi:hypothetical protein